MMMDDGFFWFRRNRLVIPGVRGEHLFMHVTDTHVNVCDEAGTDEEREKAEKQEEMWKTFKERFARANGEPYGDEQRITTLEAFEKQLALAEELRPEALLLSGDNLEYSHPAGERYLTKRLGEYGGKLLCVPGNHEDQTFGSLWTPGVKTLDFDGFRIAAVDDSRKMVSRDDLDALHDLCREGIPLIVLCHIPLSTPCCREECKEKMTGMNDYFYIDGETADELGREFVSLCEKNDAVKAVICGHVHGYYAMELAPGKKQIIGSQGMAGAVHLLTVAGD
ncbi:MAG: metallophosphoesterase [Oscillospiraceae bacterium]|nr:metallophosphoesterase [Oscillospiraceae bacterium]